MKTPSLELAELERRWENCPGNLLDGATYRDKIIRDAIALAKQQQAELEALRSGTHKGLDPLDCEEGRWGMVSDFLDGEKLPESINEAIYGLCNGTHIVVEKK